MTSLDLIGEKGSAALKRLLTTCNDPIEAITSFQTSNAIKGPALAPALKLLDLHEVRRSEYHEIVANDLRERLIAKIRELANCAIAADPSTPTTCKNESNSLAKINELVIKGFPFVNVPHLRPVILEALKQLPKLPDFYLSRVKVEPTLYKDAAVEVKQQIWIDDEELFLRELTPVFNLYLESKRTFFLDIDSCFPNYYAELSKSRRKNVHISTLCSMVGKSTVLYDRLLSHLRQFYFSSSNEHFCSLRSELLMALRDRDMQELLAVDSCHKFAWCLDACLKDKHLDPKHASELKTVLDSTAKKRSEKDKHLLADLAMIVADPYVLHFLNQLVSKLINLCITNETLPRDNASFNLILRLLNLGLHVKEIVEKCLSSPFGTIPDGIDDLKEPKIDTIIYTKFLSSLMSMICRDQFKIGKQNLLIDDSQDTVNNDEDTLIQNLLPESVIEPFIISDPLCCRIVMYYVLEMLKRRYLEVVLSKAWFYLSRSHCEIGGPYSETFLHLLIYHLLSLAERLGSEDDAFDAVFGKFLLKQISLPCVKYQTAKLALFCASKFPKIKREYLLECFKTAKEDVGDLETVGEESSKDRREFEMIFEAVETKFDDIDIRENELQALGAAGNAATETLAPAHILNARSLSDDFPDVPTPMTPHF